jgi:undecaprenyl-diphosphatase
MFALTSGAVVDTTSGVASMEPWGTAMIVDGGGGGGFAPSALLRALVLGVVQGITEFLPISSDGHLAVGQRLLGLSEPSLVLTVMLHLGTLIAVVLFYRRELGAMLRAAVGALSRSPGGSWSERWRSDGALRLIGWLGVASVPTAVIGLALKDTMERWTADPVYAGVGFLVSAAMLWATRYVGGAAAPRTEDRPGLRDALLIGALQGLAVAPGVSRSGLTIATGIFLGLDARVAARFSFLLSIPAVAGAIALEARHIDSPSELAVDLLGAAVALVTGLLALRWLITLVGRGALYRFAFYLVPVGLLTIGWGLSVAR